MPQKTKRVGQWKVGDKVFQLDPKWIEAGLIPHPTSNGGVIVSFSKDKKSAHVREYIGSFYWVPIERLQEYGESAFSASHWFEQAIRIR